MNFFPQISLRLPIENIRNSEEFLGFENGDLDFPQHEHKDLKRSDPHAVTKKPPTQKIIVESLEEPEFSSEEQQQPYRETITSSSSRKSHQIQEPKQNIKIEQPQPFYRNHKPSYEETKRSSSSSSSSVNSSPNNNNYDKVLLTLQDQYIPTLPKIIITASASVSDASGKKLNYSVGSVIGTNVKIPPPSYDEYKEDDVGLDPFFLDVPKIKPRRIKRDLKLINLNISNRNQRLVKMKKMKII